MPGAIALRCYAGRDRSFAEPSFDPSGRPRVSREVCRKSRQGAQDDRNDYRPSHGPKPVTDPRKDPMPYYPQTAAGNHYRRQHPHLRGRDSRRPSENRHTGRSTSASAARNSRNVATGSSSVSRSSRKCAPDEQSRVPLRRDAIVRNGPIVRVLHARSRPAVLDNTLEFAVGNSPPQAGGKNNAAGRVGQFRTVSSGV